MLAMLVSMTSCREDDVIVLTEYESLPMLDRESPFAGFYLLNEGNMGSNKCTLDFVDFEQGQYARNLYAERNPNVVKELGDVGNDIQIYGSKLYAVINCSHKVEVLDARTCRRIGQVDIPNCRYVAFDGGYAYVSSYVGPVGIDPNAQLGAVFQVDTATLEVTAEVTVGYQPDELVVQDGLIYVANSGGYHVPEYDNRISVIDLNTFDVTDVITVEQSANYHRLDSDSKGRLWLSSRGDYYGSVSNLYVIDPESKKVIKTMDVPVSDMWADGDTLYVISTEWSYVTGNNDVSYAKVDMESMEVIDRNIIKDGTDKSIKLPYGIAVDPVSKDFYVSDAKSYVISGTLYCFDKDGYLKWKQTSGQIPAHFAFRGRVEYKE